MLYLAIDQHRKQLTVNLRNEKGDVVLKQQVSTQWERVRKFFDDLLDRSGADGGFAAILEVCGFNHWLLAMLREYDCRNIVLVQPDTRSKKGSSSFLVGNPGSCVRGVAATCVFGTKGRAVFSAENRGSFPIYLPFVLKTHFVHPLNCTKNPKKKTGRRDANSLGELLWVNRSRLLAGQNVHGLKRVVMPGHEEMDLLLKQWELWDSQLAALEKKLEQRQAADKKATLVATMPGAGAYSSLALASRLGSIDKQGSSMARFILGQMVLHVLRRDATMKAWYKRIKHRRGSKIARVAVMRRLAG